MDLRLLAVTAFLIGGCADSENPAASADMPDDAMTIAALAPSGSGYPDLDGSVLNYSYNDWSSFHFAVLDNKIKWHGYEGYFKDITREVVPQISRVGENVYFASWQTNGVGGDNVVQNFNTMEVNAHLNPNERAPETLEMITGVIHCRDTPECVFPADPLTPNDQVGPMIGKNIADQNLPPLGDAELNTTLRHEADRIAREELAGLAIVLDTPYGTTRIEIDGAETRVSENGGAAESHLTFATKIDEDIYFISWIGDPGGNHVVINRDWMKAFDHISPTGERAEMIYDVACFGPAADC